MRYLALATDYDGTLASDGRVENHVLSALQRARDSGRQLVLVTGRLWPDLQNVFPEYKLFHRVVAENGALLIDPATNEETVLGEPPPECFVELLSELGVPPVSLGRVIVATWEPHEAAVLAAIRDLGLELQVIFNKGAVMVLPSGVNKASGLSAALAALGISRHNCVAIGDAENDHALLEQCELGVAVNNAIPMLKEHADWVTRGERGDGVVELVEEWFASSLSRRTPARNRGRIVLGHDQNGEAFTIPTQGAKILLCGSSGSGKSTLTGALLEQLTEHEYQFAVIDPEGDFETSPGRVVMGDAQHAPDPSEVVKALAVTPANVVVNLLGVALDERAAFAAVLLRQFRHHQECFGRPHWIVIDEAHHMLGKDMDVKATELHDPSSGVLLVTVHPTHLRKSELDMVDTMIVIGNTPRETLRELGVALSVSMPVPPEGTLPPGTAVVWSRRRPAELATLSMVEPRLQRRRHQRKYAVGELGPDKSFYFRGPSEALNLRAHNLALFLQMADGVDTETWRYHLERNDYSTWLREAVKDDQLAEEVREIESMGEPPDDSRARVRRAIDRRYTLSA